MLKLLPYFNTPFVDVVASGTLSTPLATSKLLPTCIIPLLVVVASATPAPAIALYTASAVGTCVVSPLVTEFARVTTPFALVVAVCTSISPSFVAVIAPD